MRRGGRGVPETTRPELGLERCCHNVSMALLSSAASIESEIDRAHRNHPLLRLPYGEAMLGLLTAIDNRDALLAETLTLQQRSITVGNAVSAVKQAARWIALDSNPTHHNSGPTWTVADALGLLEAAE